MPALPLDEAGKYVAAAYLVFLALVLIYVAIMASKLVRIERQAAELNELAARAERRRAGAAGVDETTSVGAQPVRAEPVERP
jgi:type II secretory pathway component PulM